MNVCLFGDFAVGIGRDVLFVGEFLITDSVLLVGSFVLGRSFLFDGCFFPGGSFDLGRSGGAAAVDAYAVLSEAVAGGRDLLRLHIAAGGAGVDSRTFVGAGRCSYNCIMAVTGSVYISVNIAIITNGTGMGCVTLLGAGRCSYN